MAAPASTLMVCWNEAALRNESVDSEALVTPSSTGTAEAGCLPSAIRASLILPSFSRSISSPGSSPVSPVRVICTFESIFLMMTSKCLSLMFWPCERYTFCTSVSR